jgi:PAS domain S-box-containing protein
MIKSKSGRLLIVDDEIDLVKSLCDILTKVGYETVGFTSGRDALKALKEQSFDLMLSDLVMPEMDGITLLRAALEIDPNIVGIILTGKGTIQSAVDAMKVGAFDYVLKPFKLKALLLTLNRALEVRWLREAEEKYRTMFEKAVEGIYQITPNGLYITANIALSSILGYESPEELIINLNNTGHRLYVEPDRRAEFVRMMHEIDAVSGFVSQVYRKDGSKIWVSENAVAVRNANGKLLYYKGSVEDITERKQMEEELKKRVQELEDFYSMSVNRELKMLELKKEIESLRKELLKYKKEE